MKPTSNGYLIVSLDFELYWGVFDSFDLESYKNDLLNVQKVIPSLLKLADSYGVKLTFASVGSLFAKNRNEFMSFIPKEKPTYDNPKFDAYRLLNRLDNSDENNQCLFANPLLKEIIQNGNHEIGGHTFCHYYCNEEGQTIEQFENDLQANIAIARANNVDLKSIVFPRNQVNNDYLQLCIDYGILSYRGTEQHPIYQTTDTKTLNNWFYKVFRLMDTYVNLTGHHTYPLSETNENGILNLRSSRFLRPYSKLLSIFEPLKIRRIKKSMSYAAKRNQIFHLWWHPHNFGSNTEVNFKQLENLFKHYSQLNMQNDFSSSTMSELSEKTLPINHKRSNTYSAYLAQRMSSHQSKIYEE